MTEDERILTLHPDPEKQGVRIRRSAYDALSQALLQVIPKSAEGVPFGDLAELVEPLLADSAFPPDASIPWYVVAVKQDLEARGTIEQVEGRGPQRLRRL